VARKPHQVNGALDNAGQFTEWFGNAGTVAINGLLTNEATGQIKSLWGRLIPGLLGMGHGLWPASPLAAAV